MSEIKMVNGNMKINFYVFDNGNAMYIENGEPKYIEDFAEKYIALREIGFEDER